MCDGDDGPAVARVRIRDYDRVTFVVRVCQQCKSDHADETVKVYKDLTAKTGKR